MVIAKKNPDEKVAPEKTSTGRRTSNLSRDKGHIFKFMHEEMDPIAKITRKRIITFMDVATNKPLTRVGFATFKGGDIDVIKIVSFEGHEEVLLRRTDMRKGKKLIIVNTGKKTPMMKYDIYALEGVEK